MGTKIFISKNLKKSKKLVKKQKYLSYTIFIKTGFVNFKKTLCFNFDF